METVEVAVVRPVAVKIDTAAAMAEVSRSTLYGWLKAGKLRSVPVGADQRILLADLEEFLRSGRGAGPTNANRDRVAAAIQARARPAVPRSRRA